MQHPNITINCKILYFSLKFLVISIRPNSSNPSPQGDLFRSRLENILDRKHGLLKWLSVKTYLRWGNIKVINQSLPGLVLGQSHLTAPLGTFNICCRIPGEPMLTDATLIMRQHSLPFYINMLLPGSTNRFELSQNIVNIKATRRLTLWKIQKCFQKVCSHDSCCTERIHAFC